VSIALYADKAGWKSRSSTASNISNLCSIQWEGCLIHIRSHFIGFASLAWSAKDVRAHLDGLKQRQTCIKLQGSVEFHVTYGQADNTETTPLFEPQVLLIYHLWQHYLDYQVPTMLTAPRTSAEYLPPGLGNAIKE